MSDTKTVVVTGASSGIGKEAAKALAAIGWHVIAHGRDSARSEAAEAEIRSVATGRVDMLTCDLALAVRHRADGRRNCRADNTDRCAAVQCGRDEQRTGGDRGGQ